MEEPTSPRWTSSLVIEEARDVLLAHNDLRRAEKPFAGPKAALPEVDNLT